MIHWGSQKLITGSSTYEWANYNFSRQQFLMVDLINESSKYCYSSLIENTAGF